MKIGGISLGWLGVLGILCSITSVATANETQLDLDPEIIESSPTLQRWQEEIPNILESIRNEPSFRTRLRLGYTQFLAGEDRGGFTVGVEDLFLGRTGLAASGSYQASWQSDRLSTGADLQYYLLPLGSYVNLAPVLGYRYLEVDEYSSDGVNVGARLILVLSPNGAADLAITQSFVAPGSDEEVGITKLSVGYAIASSWRLSTDIQQQNSHEDHENRVSIAVEWMP